MDQYFQSQQKQYLDPLRLKTDSLASLNALPHLSFILQFDFRLHKPYLSKDEQDFYILDNPVRRDKVFKLPYVAPSQWKDALRSAMMLELVKQETSLDDENWLKRRLQLTHLFGNEKGIDLDDERFEAFLDQPRPDQPRPDLAREYRQRLKELTNSGFLAGRLCFFPTFFEKIGLEVINPHPRDTGAGKQPIYIESVPCGTSGTFTLLYVPFDRIGKDARKTRREVAEDLALVAQGLKAMFTTYGFGAKTSSGFGVAEETFVKDAQGKSQAIIRVKGGKAYRYRSFAGLCQVAEKLAKELSDAA